MHDLFNGDDPRHIRPEWRLGDGDEGPQILRVEAKDDIEPGQSGECYILDWTGAAMVKSDRKITVYDPLKILCALKSLSSDNGDRFRVIWNVDSRRYEPLGEFGLLRRAKLATAQGDGATATAKLWKYNGAADAETAVTVDTFDWLMKSGDADIAISKKTYLGYDRDRNAWGLVDWECP